jgi:excisionase family DNA binding protein
MMKINLNAQEAAEALGISPRTLWQLTKQGNIPHLRLGSRVMYPQESLTKWANGQAQLQMKGAA